MKIALGIDIGGTNTAFGFVDSEGNCLAEGNISSTKHARVEDFIAELANASKLCLKSIDAEHELIGIGIGAPNANYLKGTIDDAANLIWKGRINLIDLMKQHFDLPIFVNNDANTAAIGEMMFGAGKGMKDFICLTLGTGLGSGIIVNGQMQYGHLGIAGEMGHIIVSNNGRACGCGRKGCLETYVSARGLRTTALELLAKNTDDSILRELPEGEIDSKQVYEAAIKGDKIALEAFTLTGDILGLALANYAALANPEAIFLLGGLAKAGALIFEPTQKAMEENVLHLLSGKTKLLASGIHGNASILGASAMVFQE
jgi:glucokinase